MEAPCCLKEVVTTLRRQSERMVRALRIRGCDFVVRTVGVVIGRGEGADITEAKVLAGDPFVDDPPQLAPFDR